MHALRLMLAQMLFDRLEGPIPNFRNSIESFVEAVNTAAQVLKEHHNLTQQRQQEYAYFCSGAVIWGCVWVQRPLSLRLAA